MTARIPAPLIADDALLAATRQADQHERRFDKSRTSDDVLVASATCARMSGGLFAIHDGAAERLDWLPGVGLCVDDRRAVRVLWGRAEVLGELLLYDERGVSHYLRVDEVLDGHDVAFAGDQILVVSTRHNAIVALGLDGRVTARYVLPGESDAWHVNCLTFHDGEAYATAFATTTQHRRWKDEALDGLVFRLSDGRIVVSGLHHPHSPRFLDGSLVVCNSGAFEIVEVDGKGSVARRQHLGGWTRGLAADETSVYVGVSAPPEDAGSGGGDGHATGIYTLDRRTWAIRSFTPLPASGVYDLVWVRRELLEGLRRGFVPAGVATNTGEPVQSMANLVFGSEHVRNAARPLRPEECRAQLTGAAPAACVAGATVNVDFTVTNTGPAMYSPAPPSPVGIGFWWTLEDGSRVDDGVRARSDHVIAPHESFTSQISVPAPDTPGSHVLHVGVVQEHVRWFDDVDPQASFEATVDVKPEG